MKALHPNSKRWLAILLAIWIALSLNAQARPQEQSATESISVLLDQLEDGWRQADPSAVAAVFTEDADFIVGDGTHLEDNAAIEAYMELAFEHFMPGGYPVTEVKSLQFINDRVAIIHTEGGILLPGESDVPEDRLGVQTFVAVQQQGRWLFRAYQNTRIDGSTP